MRIIVQQLKENIPLNLTNIWCKNGCPKKMIIHSPSETFYLLDGTQTDAKTLQEANEINNLQPQISVTDPTIRLSVTGRHLVTCQFCNKPFIASRTTAKFCKPSHRVLFFRGQRGVMNGEEAQGMSRMSPVR